MKLFDLTGKVALVTGGNGGIGLAMAKALGEAGAKIVVAGRNQEKNDQSIKILQSLDIESTSLIVDVVDEVSCNKLIDDTVAHFGKLNILVNNAGTNIPESFLNVKKSSMETLLNVNNKAVFNVAQLCANQIIKLKRKSGSIINISSIFGLVAGKKRTVYSMTKFGVEGLTRGMALDLAKFNIRVNSVCPNIVLTPRTKKYFADKKYNKYVKENTPINKIVTVSDVATSITFLASEAASMITGTSIIIDGGWTAK